MNPDKARKAAKAMRKAADAMQALQEDMEGDTTTTDLLDINERLIRWMDYQQDRHAMGLPFDPCGPDALGSTKGSVPSIESSGPVPPAPPKREPADRIVYEGLWGAACILVGHPVEDREIEMKNNCSYRAKYVQVDGKWVFRVIERTT